MGGSKDIVSPASLKAVVSPPSLKDVVSPTEVSVSSFFLIIRVRSTVILSRVVNAFPQQGCDGFPLADLPSRGLC